MTTLLLISLLNFYPTEYCSQQREDMGYGEARENDNRCRQIDLLYGSTGLLLGFAIPAVAMVNSIDEDALLSRLGNLAVIYLCGFPYSQIWFTMPLITSIYGTISLYLSSSLQHERDVRGELLGAIPGVTVLVSGLALTSIPFIGILVGDTYSPWNVLAFWGTFLTLISPPIVLIGMMIGDSYE